MKQPGHRSAFGRRTFLRVGAAAGATSLSPAVTSTASASAATRKTRAYVIVDGGSRVSDQVSMLTGVLPDRHGIPADLIYDRREERIRELDRPGDLHYPTILERLQDKGLTTGSAVASRPLCGVLGDRATYRTEPPLGHRADRGAMTAAASMVASSDPVLLFGSLTGGDEVGRLVDLLRDTGRWRESVVIVLAGKPPSPIHRVRPDALRARLDADPLLTGRVQVVPTGGSALVYWTGPLDAHSEAVRRVRALALDTPGVVSVHRPPDLGLGARAGDVIAWCGTGRRFTDPASYSGGITMSVTGGSPLVRHLTSTLVRAVDVAPTVGSIFGLAAPRGGYDGSSRL